MQKLLLTSSQVGFLISTVIVLFCTVSLFLAGYVLQQQTVENLHRTLRPLSPSPRHYLDDIHPILKTNDAPERLTSRLTGSFRKFAQQVYLLEDKKPQFDWSKFAQAQLVREHEDVCNAVITFHELHKQRSAAPRLLLFPKVWLDAKDGGMEAETSLRLIRKASRLYGAILVPTTPLKKDANETHGSSYSVGSVFSLTNYDRIMMLPSPGLLLNSKPFDSMLAYFEPRDGVALYPLNANPMYLIRPNMTAFEIVSKDASAMELDSNVVKSITTSPESLLSDTDPDYKTSLYMTLDDLRTMKPEPAFNATAFFQSTAFIRIEDSTLPGPEFEIPYEYIVDHRPDDVDQAFIWEKMYSLYKSRRYTVCGLDPKPFPEEKPIIKNDEEETTDVKQDL